MRKSVIKVNPSLITLSVFDNNELRVVTSVINDKMTLTNIANILLPMDIEELLVVFPLNAVKRIMDTFTVSLDAIDSDLFVTAKEDLEGIDELARICGIKKVIKTTMKSVYDYVAQDQNIIIMDDSGSMHVTLIAYKGSAVQYVESLPSGLTSSLSTLSEKHGLLNAVYIRKKFKELLEPIPGFEDEYYEIYGDLVIASRLNVTEESFEDKAAFDKKVRVKRSKDKITQLIKGEETRAEIKDESVQFDNIPKDVGLLDKLYRGIFGASLILLVVLFAVNFFMGTNKSEVQKFDPEAVHVLSTQLDKYYNQSDSVDDSSVLLATLKSIDKLNLTKSITYQWGMCKVSVESNNKASVLQLLKNIQGYYTFYEQPTITTAEGGKDKGRTVAVFTLFQ